jgi:molybdopterin/thiamine biosynthesis adenylyltransferase
MRLYSVTFLEEDYLSLQRLLAANAEVENGAYLLCRQAHTPAETRLLVREVIPIEAQHVLEASPVHMKIASASFRRAMKKANDEKCGFVFVHTHPNSLKGHSAQDDREENSLFRTAYIRIHTDIVHASLVFTSEGVSAGRVWLRDGTTQPIETVRIIGKRFRFWFSSEVATPVPEFFDRQVRAFGSDLQKLLARLKVGIVGMGGTGSAVIEQLTRLGVGELVVADGQTFEASNVNRLYGSRTIDQDIAKVKIGQRLVADIGLGTKLSVIDRPVTYRSAFLPFRECDIIFGCTDEEWGRSLLSRASIYYGIPVFDIGVRIDSEEGVIRSIQGRVTTLLPGAACLFCRGRITAERVGIESQRETNPEAAAARVREGYAPEVEDPAPAVIPFTTTVAASAVTELVHRLTGFMGAERDSTEVLHLFDATTTRRNSKQPIVGCFCSPRAFWMRGDTRPLLDTAWRSE